MNAGRFRRAVLPATVALLVAVVIMGRRAALSAGPNADASALVGTWIFGPDAHVVANCALNELRFLLPSPGAKIVEEGEQVRLDPRYVILREPLELESMRQDEDLDVAILKFPATDPIRPFWSFRQLRRLPIPAPSLCST